MTKKYNASEWTSITIEEIKKRFHKDFYQDIKALSMYCIKAEKDWTIDIQKIEEQVMIIFVSEDVSWIYELESEKSQYYRQIFLARDNIHYVLRRMNEKRKIRSI